MNRLFTASLLTLSSLFLFVPSAWASVLYLSPASQSINSGSNLSVQVKLDSQGDVINGLSAYLSYPKDRLEVTDIQLNKETLPIEAEKTSDNGLIKISGANLSSISGSDLSIATINFKAKGSGNAAVNFIDGSAAPRTFDSSDSLNLSSSKGANFIINDSSDSNSGGGSNSTPQPSDHKILRCQDKEASTKTRISVINSSFGDIKSRLDTIFALVDDYFTNVLTPSGKAPANYLSQRQQVDSKRAQALTQLEKLKTDIANFNCGIKSPKDNLVQIKNESSSTQKSFKDYRDALKSLIKTLR